MSWSQTVVVTWLQFAGAALLLLLAARVAMRWIVQPAERIRLIQCALAAAIAVPLLVACAPLPAWRLRIISGRGPTEAIDAQRAQAEPKLVSTAVGRAPLPLDVGGPMGFPLDEPVVNEAPPAPAAPAAVSLAPS